METDVMDPYLAAPAARNFLARFVEGAATPVRGFRYLNRNRALWRFAILPLVFNALITTTAFLLLFTVAGWFYAQFHPWITEGLADVWRWLVLIAEVVVGLVLLHRRIQMYHVEAAPSRCLSVTGVHLTG